MTALPVHRAQSLRHRRVRHGFFGRGSPENSRARTQAAQALGIAPEALIGVHQVHSARAIVVDGPWTGAAPEADALATKAPGLALGIRTADCAPVLLADFGAGVIGAAHAGWRGARAGILEAAIAAMCGLGASAGTIRAAIGPCISQRSYEVGPEFYQGFVTNDRQATRFFVPGHGDRWQFDLPGYCAARLRAAGVGAVETLDLDTCALGQAFFSYRRACLHGEADQGRNLSVIHLRES